MPDSGGRRDESGLNLGDRLRSARKARAVSLERVAETLHLDESIVLALEEERFDALGAPVFVRGHLRAYARLVGLDPEAIVTAYEPAEPAEIAPPPVEKVVGRSLAINPALLGVSVLVAVVVIALAAYVIQDDDTVATVGEAGSATVDTSGAVPARSESPQSGVRASEAAQTEVARTGVPATSFPGGPAEVLPESESSLGSAESEVVAAAPAYASVATASPVDSVSRSESEPLSGEPVSSAPIVRPSADTVRLSLMFNEESWVEISDVNRRLIFGLQRPGRRREVEGEPPISLLIGNAQGVELSVNDEPYTVPSSGLRGNVARFEIGTDAVQ